MTTIQSEIRTLYRYFLHYDLKIYKDGTYTTAFTKNVSNRAKYQGYEILIKYNCSELK